MDLAVIFDFDGVITDSEILHFRSFNMALKPYGIQFTRQEYYKEWLGLSDIDCIKTLIQQGRLKITESEIETLAKSKNHLFEELAESDGKIIDGVRDFLQTLKSNNIPMAICSGALLVEINLILEQAGLEEFFTEIISAEQVKRGKPYPDGFILTLEKLNRKLRRGMKPGQCVVIEDSHWGLNAAIAAGMHTVAITNSYDAEQLSMAEKVICNLSELTIAELQSICSRPAPSAKDD